MFRSLLSCASIFVLLISMLFSPALVSASRCGVKLPSTLLSLYRSSEFIYVGTFDRVEEGEITEETEDYRVIPIKKYFSLSSSLKGETKKMLVLEESQYHYKENRLKEDVGVEEGATPSETDSEESSTAESASEAEEVEGEAESDVDDSELKPGDRVLLFLEKDDESGELDLVDYSDGIKKMTPERLSSYEPRIRELNSIFSKAEPSYTEIVAWIVRCAEDPQTRWEGTYELQRSFQVMDLKAARAKLAEQKPQGQDEELDEYQPRASEKFDTGDENFAKELTEGQKLLLTNAWLNRERPTPTEVNSSDDTPGLIRGDRELIDLVARWGDSKVAINVLEQLRYDSSDSNLNSDLMSSIASMLNDDELSALAQQYAGIQWQDEGDEIEE
jgi:hypothetical protein